MGEMQAPEFSATSKDEIGVLAESFSRMRKSLAHAMKLLEA
jgi:HAMP domain-containing protein